MTERISPREVRDLAEQGHIEPETARRMFEMIRTENPLEGSVRIQIKEFKHQQHAPEGYYHDKRKELERKVRHVAGTPVYIAAGIADGIMDGVIYAASELAEDISFGISRLSVRLHDGWQRGQRR